MTDIVRTADIWGKKKASENVKALVTQFNNYDGKRQYHGPVAPCVVWKTTD